MRIVYGCNTQGQGHLSKAAVLVPLLEQAGHEVHVVSSGPTPPPEYQFQRHVHVAGMEYVITNGKTDFGGTAKKWLKQVPTLLKSFWRVRRLIQEVEPERILTDFEPFLASPLLDPPCEVVSLCRQVTLLDPNVRLPETLPSEQKFGRTMIRVFTFGADRWHGYHYEPASHRCTPPVLRMEIPDLQPENGDHVFVYNFNTTREEAERLIDWSQTRRQEVIAYGFPQMERGKQGRVVFRPSDRAQIMRDLAGCRGALVTAGLSTPLEAFRLRKPLVVVPIPGQWEQMTNAFHLEQAKIGRSSANWDYDLVYEVPEPSSAHPSWRWLNTRPEEVLAHVLRIPMPGVGEPIRRSDVAA